MAKGSGKTTFIVFIMFMMCLSSIVAAGGLYVTSKEKVDASNLEIRSEATNIAVLPRPGNIVGRYNATSLKGTKWNDLSGKGNHITSEKIKGTLTKAEGFKGEYVKGTKDDGFTLPQQFENNHWSFFAVARYGSDKNQNRIFVSGEDTNWFIGHLSGLTGVAKYDNPDDPDHPYVAQMVTPLTNNNALINVHGTRPWIRITAQHNYFATNGKSRSTDFSFDTDEQKPHNNPKSIGINVGKYMDTQSSDWNVYEILIYDTYLDTVDREKVDTYLKEKYILADLKSGISLAGGRPKIEGDIKLSTDDGKGEPWYGGKERFGTQEDCRRFAQELGYPQWGHYNEKYSDKSKVNTCFFYGDTVVEIKDTDKTEDGTVDGKTREDMTFGCTKTYRTPEMNCESGSGTGGPNTIGGVAATASGAYCQAKKGLNQSVGKDWVQANVCSTHCNRDKCMEPGATFTYSASGASNTLTDYCEWNNTPDFEKFYNDELIKDVATHSNAEIPNKDEDENYIDYLGKHLATCKDFKYVVEGANTNSRVLKNPPDTSRSASSVYGDNAMGTGHGQGRLDSAQAWSAKDNQVGEWYQINNDKVAIISGIKIQKRAPNHTSQYVETFKVKAKGVAGTWEDVDDGAIFTGNTSGGGDKVDVFFETPVEARYIRIYPQTWGTHMSLRAGIYVGK